MKDYQNILFMSEHLIIRPLNRKDYKKWLSAPSTLESVDPDLLSREGFRKSLVRCDKLANTDQRYYMNIFLKNADEVIGTCEITTYYRGELQYASIAYRLDDSYWIHAYAIEALRSLISIGFDDLHFHRLETAVQLGNEASKTIALNSGMQFECLRKAFILKEGQWHDQEIYYINKDHYDARQLLR